MSKEVRVTSEEFERLKNPYTGLTMRVLMVVTDRGDPLFHADPTEYSPSQEKESAKICYDLWNRVGGIGGMKNGQQIVCAYTGEPLSLVHTGSGCRYDGGFNPHMLYTRAEFLYRASMRGGVSKYPKPVQGSRVTQLKRFETTEARTYKDRGGDVSGEAVDTAAAAMQSHKRLFERASTVHISRQRAKGKR